MSRRYFQGVCRIFDDLNGYESNPFKPPLARLFSILGQTFCVGVFEIRGGQSRVIRSRRIRWALPEVTGGRLIIGQSGQYVWAIRIETTARDKEGVED